MHPAILFRTIISKAQRILKFVRTSLVDAHFVIQYSVNFPCRFTICISFKNKRRWLALVILVRPQVASMKGIMYQHGVRQLKAVA